MYFPLFLFHRPYLFFFIRTSSFYQKNCCFHKKIVDYFHHKCVIKQAYRKTETRDPRKTGEPGPGTLVGPQQDPEKTGKPEPGTLVRLQRDPRKTGNLGPETLVGPQRDPRKTGKPETETLMGFQWDTRKTRNPVPEICKLVISKRLY